MTAESTSLHSCQMCPGRQNLPGSRTSAGRTFATVVPELVSALWFLLLQPHQSPGDPTLLLKNLGPSLGCSVGIGVVMDPRLCGPKLFAIVKTFVPSPCLYLLDRVVTLKISLEGVFWLRLAFLYTVLDIKPCSFFLLLIIWQIK